MTVGILPMLTVLLLGKIVGLATDISHPSFLNKGPTIVLLSVNFTLPLQGLKCISDDIDC